MMRNTEVVQAFNAQIAVDAESQVIVAEGVSNQPPDAEYFEPMLERIVENCDGDAPIAVSADNGYLSKAAIDAAKRHGVNAHLAFGREEKAPKAPTTEALTPAQKARAAMRRKLGTPTGKAIYARRKCIVEPAFGQIKRGAPIPSLLDERPRKGAGRMDARLSHTQPAEAFPQPRQPGCTGAETRNELSSTAGAPTARPTAVPARLALRPTGS